MDEKITTNNAAWKKLFIEHDIPAKIQKDGVFSITAQQIKKYREPRLMAKWDSSESLPEVLRDTKINILPDSRSTYLLGDFQLYQVLPDLKEHVTKMKRVEIPPYESIDVNNITSEANAINVLALSSVLQDFLGEEENAMTFNGRMGTGNFSFYVNTNRGRQEIAVRNAQCEIDAGFENAHSVVIMEAKNIVRPDFHIRQLYYPYRLWQTRVKKPIRLVFSVYSNKIFRLFEYAFADINDYSSIQLIQKRNYSFQDVSIGDDDLFKVYQETKVVTDDNMDDTKIPFIQADSFEKVIFLLEQLSEQGMTAQEVAEMMQFETRQSDYYFNAGKYLGLFEKERVEKKDKKLMKLTKLGEKVYRMNYKDRQLKLVSLMFEHRIFSELFFDYHNTGELPDKEMIIAKMKKYNVCKDSINRRASSVSSWLKWIIRLSYLENE